MIWLGKQKGLHIISMRIFKKILTKLYLENIRKIHKLCLGGFLAMSYKIYLYNLLKSFGFLLFAENRFFVDIYRQKQRGHE